METIEQIAMTPDALEKTRDATAIAVDDIYKSFGSQRVLDGVSLTVTRGETLAVLGRSGTGKSVLLRLIIGLEKPDFSFSTPRFTIRSQSSRTWLFHCSIIRRRCRSQNRATG